MAKAEEENEDSVEQQEVSSSSLPLQRFRSPAEASQRSGGGTPGLGAALVTGAAVAVVSALGATVRALLIRSRRARSRGPSPLVARLSLPGKPSPSPPASPLPLDSVHFVASEEISLDNCPPSAGAELVSNLDFPSDSRAPSADALSRSGAACIGKAKVAPLLACVGSCSLPSPLGNGRTGRTPGGSATGCAVAVASGECQLALASDCAGDVRAPAVACGVFGMRLSAGVSSLDGCIVASESLQSVGVIALNPSVLLTAVQALVQHSTTTSSSSTLPTAPPAASTSSAQPTSPPARFISATDAVTPCESDVRQSTAALATACGSPAATVSLSQRLLDSCQTLSHFNSSDALDACRQVLDTIFWKESYARFKKHVDGQSLDSFEHGAQIAMSEGAQVALKSYRKALQAQEEVREAMEDMLAGGGVLLLPATPSQPPSTSDANGVERWERQSKNLLAPASLAGQPAVALTDGSGAGTGASMVGGRGRDVQIATAAAKAAHVAQERGSKTRAGNASIATKYGGSSAGARRESSKSLAGAFDRARGAGTSSSNSSSAAQASDSEPSAAEQQKAGGNEQVKQGNFESALELYTSAIQKCAESKEDESKTLAVSLSNRAQANIKMGRHEDAEKDCSEALKVDEKLVKAFFRRGAARNALGRQQEALSDFKEAQRLEPNNYQANSEVARLEANLIRQGQQVQEEANDNQGVGEEVQVSRGADAEEAVAQNESS